MIDIFNNGGPVMYPLLACSVVVLTVIIERFLFWLREDMRRQRKLIGDVMTLCEKGDWHAVRQRAEGRRNYILRILITGILHREFSMSKAMEAAAADELKNMRRYMNILDTMITVAPLMGIFGTVLGIISSFDMLGSAGLEHPELVTRGIAQALITTATGLGIAILTVFPYNYFNSRIDNAVRLIEQYATSLEVIYERLDHEYCRPQDTAP